jgi:hypothetical protein
MYFYLKKSLIFILSHNTLKSLDKYYHIVASNQRIQSPSKL